MTWTTALLQTWRTRRLGRNDHRRKRLKGAIALSSLTSVLLIGSAAMADGRLPTGPTAGDAELSTFYRWNVPLPRKPGVMLRMEKVHAPAEIDPAVEATRILHTSTEARWRSGQVPVSGLLYLPSGKPPAGGWPILAWGHGTVGIADMCAPSWTSHRARDATYLNRWLRAGFAVVATDYQGLGGPGPHPYLYWQAEGRSILDSVRAALASHSKQISNRVFIAGQSQGSGAALGAAHLANSYAPELKVLGVIATGVNSTFPNGPVKLPERNSNNMFLSFASGGLRDGGPVIEDILSPAGRQLLDTARSGCTREIAAQSRKLKLNGLADTLSISLEQLAPTRIPVTDMPMQRMRFPFLIATGLADDTTIPFRQYAAAAALCASGNTVLWLRYDGLGHDGALNGSFDDALAFARSRLASRAVAGNCSQINAPGPPGRLKEGIPFND